MQFQKMAELFDQIQQTASRLEMMNQLAGFFEKLSPQDAPAFVYLLQGKLAPDYQNVKIGLGEKFVEQTIAKISGYTQSQVNQKFKQTGDLGETAEHFIAQKKQQSFFSATLSLKKVHENLLKIAKSEGTGSQEQKIRLLAELLNSATPLEARYIVRVPLEQLRMGVGDPTIMDALAITQVDSFAKKNPELVKKISDDVKTKKESEHSEELKRKLRAKIREKIEEKYNVHPDLGFIAHKILDSGLDGLNQIGISTAIPIRPTLAERLNSATEIIEKLGKCAIEAKLDGFRLQCHKNKNQVTIFSRQSENMTYMFPDLVKAIQTQITAEQAIFEAEAIAFNEQTGEFYPFQITIQRKRKYGIEEKTGEFPLKLFCFDIMFLNGHNTMSEPFLKRRKKLESMVKKGPIVQLTELIVTDNPKKVEAFFEECIERGLEGIIAKDLTAPYIAGARKFAWIKLKRSYKGELTDTVDVVIIGYYKGKGKRTQFGLGGLLSAVYDSESDSFASIAKIGTGMSEQTLGELEQMLSKISLKQKPKNVQSQLEPDYWVQPEIVIEVRADEITKSPIHQAGKTTNSDGFALRFPRMIRFRTDKKPTDATTVSEIKKMYQNQANIQLQQSAEENPFES